MVQQMAVCSAQHWATLRELRWEEVWAALVQMAGDLVLRSAALSGNHSVDWWAEPQNSSLAVSMEHD